FLYVTTAVNKENEQIWIEKGIIMSISMANVDNDGGLRTWVKKDYTLVIIIESAQPNWKAIDDHVKRVGLPMVVVVLTEGTKDTVWEIVTTRFKNVKAELSIYLK